MLVDIFICFVLFAAFVALLHTILYLVNRNSTIPTNSLFRKTNCEIKTNKVKIGFNASYNKQTILFSSKYAKWYKHSDASPLCRLVIKQVLFHEIGHAFHPRNTLAKQIGTTCCRKIDELHSDMFSLVYGFNGNKDAVVCAMKVKSYLEHNPNQYTLPDETLIKNAVAYKEQKTFLNKKYMHPSWTDREEYIKNYNQFDFELVRSALRQYCSKKLSQVELDSLATQIVNVYQETDAKIIKEFTILP